MNAEPRDTGTGGDAIAPWNWMQHYDNVVDPYHVPVLHGSFSGTQFVDLLATMPEVRFSTTPQGVIAEALRPLEDGKILRRVTEAVFPTLRIIPDPSVARFGRGESVGWLMPIDDTHYRIYTAIRSKDGAQRNRGLRPDGKTWKDLTPEERRARPGDWEAQIGQGTITLHSEEHLASSDCGLSLVRLRAGNFREDPVPA